jgi:DNA repair exonuclease SbcCD ATPase subunit
MQALLDQYKLTNQLQGKKAEPKVMKVGDRVIQVTPTGEARELYKPTESELEKLKVEQEKKDIQLTDKNINKKACDDLTLEQQEVVKADLALKKVNLAKAQQELIDSDKSVIEKQQGLANLQKTFADIKKTEAEVEKMTKTSELTPSDRAKIKESEAKIKESEARTEKYKADSKRLEEDRKQKQEVADLQKKTKERKLIEKNRQDREELENANEKIKKVERLEKLLSKQGGVTGFFDNTVQSLIDSQRVDSEATARNIARQELMDLAVDQTLLKTAQTKGAISDQEMALFQKGIPSLYAQEPEWVSWLGKVKDTQKRLIAKIQETSPTSAQPEQVQVPQTSAAEKTKLSDKDKQALNWANSNPDDPRAMKIKQRLGM